MLLSCLRNCIDSSIHKDQQRAFCQYKSIRESIKKELSSLDRESLQILKESLQVQKMANEENKLGYYLVSSIVVPLIISVITLAASFMTQMYSTANAYVLEILTSTNQPADKFPAFYKQFATDFIQQMLKIWMTAVIVSLIACLIIYSLSYYAKCKRHMFISCKSAVIDELLSSSSNPHF
ncbi:hypothetical protein [Desulfurispora thermophila]|uniref:hypothetical protein n=1 Tax=Desulfurispora thermophila TaxID=265470 RepID=UPI000372EE30|nr:hypothetical protein [Desulfurispora thermophila]